MTTSSVPGQITVDRAHGEPQITFVDARDAGHVVAHLLTEEQALKLAGDIANLLHDDLCPKGHRRTEANTHIDPVTGRPNCRLCIRGIAVGDETW